MQAGCWASNRCQVVSLLGAMPLDNSIRQALPVNPEQPSETAELMTLMYMSFLHVVASSVILWLFSRLWRKSGQVIILPHVSKKLYCYMCQWIVIHFVLQGGENTLWEHKEHLLYSLVGHIS